MKFCSLCTGPLLENQISQIVTPRLIHTQTKIIMFDIFQKVWALVGWPSSFSYTGPFIESVTQSA